MHKFYTSTTKFIAQLIIAISIFTLSGCANMKSPKNEPRTNFPTEHKAQLEQLQNWQIKAKLIFKSPEEKFSASLHWQQQTENADLRLTSFMGISIFKLKITPEQATLSFDGNDYQGPNAQQLLNQKTGFNWPINQMPKWIKGLTEVGRAQYDNKQRLQHIELIDENGYPWQIKYSTYQPVSYLGQQIQLPLSLRLKGQNVTLIIKNIQWEL